MAHPTPARIAIRCVHCERPLGADPWIAIGGGRRGAHLRCHDWSGRPFPFNARLRTLRRIWHLLPAGDARREVERAGTWLRRARARWPDDAAEVATELHARMAAVRRAVGSLVPGRVVRRL